MSKGKRIREQKNNEPLTMTRGTFKAFLFSAIDTYDDIAYKEFANIVLIACGVIDRDGKLTEQFEKSPYWTVKDGKIVPSEHTALIGELLQKGKDNG